MLKTYQQSASEGKVSQQTTNIDGKGGVKLSVWMLNLVLVETSKGFRDDRFDES